MKNNWIDIEFRERYDDSKSKGLRLFFDTGLDENIKLVVKDVCKWLRKKYFFPIRLKLFIKNCSYFKANNNKDRSADAIFIHPLNDKKEFPAIWISISTIKKSIKEKGIRYGELNALDFIAHEITHYYQWYFYENIKRSRRSLEIESTKMSSYLIFEYIEDKKWDINF